MVDSELVGIGGEVASRVADLPVVPEAGCEGEQPHPDPGAEAGQGASAVAFEPEFALASPEHRFDALANEPERAVARLLVAAVGTQEGRSLLGDEDRRGFSPTPTASSWSIWASISADGGSVLLTA
jgi:hypothetical protein